MKKSLLFIGCLLLCCGCHVRSEGMITKVTCEEMMELLKEEDTFLIDVRTEEEYNEGHLEGAILLPYDTIKDTITSIGASKESNLIVYCRSGNRSGQAASTLQSLGYQHIYDLGAMSNCNS